MPTQAIPQFVWPGLDPASAADPVKLAGQLNARLKTLQLTLAALQAAIGSGGGGGGAVTSVFGRTGAIVSGPGDYAVAQVTGAAPLASPALAGTPTAPTATAGTNTTQIASTAFVGTALGSFAPLASPTLTGTPRAPTATVGTNTTQVATTAFVLANAPAVPAWRALEVNFGTRPVRDASFTITDAAIGVGSHVAVLPAATVPTSGSLDDWRWDGASFAATPLAAGTATVHAAFFPGPVMGTRSLIYQVN